MAFGDSGQFWLRMCSLGYMQSAAIGTPERGVFPVELQCLCGADGNHPSYPPFCSLLSAGPLNIVMDLFAPEIREYLIAVRLLKVEGGEECEVLSVPAQEYESGNIALAVNLKPLAKYNILLVGNNEAGNPRRSSPSRWRSDVQETLSIPARAPAGDF